MKTCKICGYELPMDQFPTNRGREDGHLGICFECFRIMTGGRKKEKNTPNTREDMREYHREYRKNHPPTEAQREKYRAKARERYHLLRNDSVAYAKRLERMRQYYLENKQ